jgi:trk system potassium uptake protein TrkH
MVKKQADRLFGFLRRSDQFSLYLSLLCSAAIIFNLGYNENAETNVLVEQSLLICFYILGALFFLRAAAHTLSSRKRSAGQYAEFLLALYFLFVIGAQRFAITFHYADFAAPEWIYIGLFSTLIISVSKISLFFDEFYFNPTILFVISFIVLILLGTFLLILPNATTDGHLNFVDALFTATSAVCVTGLTLFDLSTKFSTFGQSVILVLIQLGGLGIMTFTGFFGYFFTGGFSYKNQLMYTELLSEEKIGSVIKTLSKIVFITLLFEAIGALLIFINLPPNFFASLSEEVYFSVFHAISAFCNAGFSTVPDGLYHPDLRFSYSIHLIFAVLIIFGGLGYHILMNTYAFVKRRIISLYRKIRFDEEQKYRAREFQFTSQIIIYTTLILLSCSTVIFFVLEYQHSLREHESLWGKAVSSFFLAVTPRSAGFITVDIHSMASPSILILLFLMWIGASPGSNGGGIKNTTFAIAFLNIYSIARGMENLELFKRRITKDTSIRALGVIMLSIIFLGTIFFLLLITDGEKDFRALFFESMSAFAIAGLSLGITPEMSQGGRIILVLAMFVGRIGALTLLVAFIRNTRLRAYKYPSDTVLL